MKNTYLNNAADSSAEDLIRAITQFGCAEVHAKDLYMQATAQLDNGLFHQEDGDELEELDAILARANMAQKSMLRYAELRRKATVALYGMYDGGDKKLWCLIKHLSIGAYTAFEAWEGSDDDPSLLQLAYDANEAFTEALTAFIGAEITDCAACLGEYLKSGGDNAEHHE